MEAKLNSKTRKLTVLFLLSVFLMISISAVAATDNDTPQWSKQAGDNQNTGQSQNLGPQNNTTKWNKSFSENDSGISGPVVGHDGTVYMQSTDYTKSLATLYAINPDGSTKWTYSLEDVNEGNHLTPTLGSDGTLYVVTCVRSGETYNSRLTAVKDDGNKAVFKWQYTILGDQTDISGSPVIGSDGTIYFGANDFVSEFTTGKIYALNPDGSLKWRYDVRTDGMNSIIGSPAIGSDGTIYFNTMTPEIFRGAALYALKDMKTHATKKWIAYMEIGDYQDLVGSPAIGPDGTIYVTENSNIYESPSFYETGYLFAFKDNGDSATEKWRYMLTEDDSSVTCGPSVSKDGTIYFGGINVAKNGLFAIKDNTNNAVLKWIFQTDNRVIHSPIIGSDGTIYFGDISQKATTFYALNSVGALKWTYHAVCLSSAALAQDGTLYFAGIKDSSILEKSQNKIKAIANLIAIKGPSSTLYVKTSVDNNNPTVGEVITVLFKVGNNGPNTAYNTILTYVVPQGFKFVKAWADVGTINYDPITRTVTWNLGNVPVGDPFGYVSLLTETVGRFSILPGISTSSDDPTIPQNIAAAIVNVHAATNNNTNNDTNSTNDTVAMQPTGIPFAMLCAAILMVLGGSIVPLRKK